MDAVGLEELGEVLSQRLDGGAVEPVSLVEHGQGHRVVVGHERDELVMEARVGVLLRVGDPDEHVDELENALGFTTVRELARVEVGKIEQDETIETLQAVRPLRARALGAVRTRWPLRPRRPDDVAGVDVQPVEQL